MYYKSENWGDSELMAYGGVVIYRNLQKKYTDGELTFVSLPYNHCSIVEERTINGLAAPALLCKISVDLYTHPELEVVDAGVLTQGYVWCVMLSEEDSDVTYAILLNAEYFNKEDVLVLAESVKFN